MQEHRNMLEQILLGLANAKDDFERRRILDSALRTCDPSMYDIFVEEMWFYDPGEHGGMPELGYTALKYCGESGEIAEKIGKAYRDNGGVIPDREALIRELGDSLFYIVKIAHLLGRNLSYVIEANKSKLLDRQTRGVLKGDGDYR